MPPDSLILNAGRWRILTALAVHEPQEFVNLRHTTQLTDGNLSTHGRRLASAGLVAIQKSFDAGKPVTRFSLTSMGRQALQNHLLNLQSALGITAAQPAASASSGRPDLQDDWVD